MHTSIKLRALALVGLLSAAVASNAADCLTDKDCGKDMRCVAGKAPCVGPTKGSFATCVIHACVKSQPKITPQACKTKKDAQPFWKR